MIEIKLTKSKIAFVDDSDYADLAQFKWSYDGRYAQRAVWNPKTKRASKEYMHRRIMETPKGKYTDHINGNELDNQKENLRICSNKDNTRNRRGVLSSKYSNYKGVTKVHGKYWAAQITVDGQNISLGYFANEKDAALAYDDAAVRYFGVFARTNFNKGDGNDTNVHTNYP